MFFRKKPKSSQLPSIFVFYKDDWICEELRGAGILFQCDRIADVLFIYVQLTSEQYDWLMNVALQKGKSIDRCKFAEEAIKRKKLNF